MFFVTGISKGLGEAIVIALLEKGEKVTGIGRSSTIKHPNYSFEYCDLSSPNQVEELHLSIPDEPITLINNAGIIGEINRLSDQKNLDLKIVLQINTVAPMELTKMIYQQVKDKSSFTLINISSGAASKAIPSWASYCASKAALNMLTETFFLEEKELGNLPKVYAVSPGVIDTNMQEQIRAVNESSFSSVQNFINLKENDELFSPKEAASRLLKLTEQNYTGQIFHDLRDVTP